jgi:hypothetical protein
MQLFSVSIREIEIDLINYIKSSFPQYTAPILHGSDVKRRYRYTPEAWAELADELSTVPWMIHLGVVLIQDDMRGVSTIAQLAGLIFKHIRHVVAAKTRVKVTPLTTLMRSSHSIEAAVTKSSKSTSRRAKSAVKKNKTKAGKTKHRS